MFTRSSLFYLNTSACTEWAFLLCDLRLKRLDTCTFIIAFSWHLAHWKCNISCISILDIFNFQTGVFFVVGSRVVCGLVVVILQVVLTTRLVQLRFVNTLCTIINTLANNERNQNVPSKSITKLRESQQQTRNVAH